MKDPSPLVFTAILAGSAALTTVLMLPRFGAPAKAPDDAPIEPVELAAPGPPAPPPPPPPKPPPPAYVRSNPESASACPSGMLLVDGIYCPFVAHKCANLVDEARDVCRDYVPEVICEGALQRRRYCIDTFEYPNLEGARPVVMVDWTEAKRACDAEGKRLCSIEEWEFACEGPGMWPFPYGVERSNEACNIDREVPKADPGALGDPFRTAPEVERVDRRVTSGERAGCVSPFGIRDMTGNVDEWVDNPTGGRVEPPFRSGLKGGGPSTGPARCRPTVLTQPPSHRGPHTGFRCCADPKGGGRTTTVLKQRSRWRQVIPAPAEPGGDAPIPSTRTP